MGQIIQPDLGRRNTRAKQQERRRDANGRTQIVFISHLPLQLPLLFPLPFSLLSFSLSLICSLSSKYRLMALDRIKHPSRHPLPAGRRHSRRRSPPRRTPPVMCHHVLLSPSHLLKQRRRRPLPVGRLPSRVNWLDPEAGKEERKGRRRC